MIEAKLAIGPMSSEIIEAVFRYSNYMRIPIMLIASKNQIDHSGGYVNKWDTKQYIDFVNKMKQKYTQSAVLVCRDHCGPGFNGNYDLSDTYKTIEEDIKNGFDLIHIDFCHFRGSKEERFAESKKAIERCLQLNPYIKLEVGTDENTGTNFGPMNLGEIEEELNFFLAFCRPEFYVVQTGSLVMEINQTGKFNRDFVKSIYQKLRERGVKLKEHNADYLSRKEISERAGIVDAMNIAPQLGVVQTQTVLNKCLIYGVPFEKFIEEVYQGGKWKKWLNKEGPENKFLCATIAGHYHFSSDNYKKLIDHLQEHEEINETIMDNVMSVIEHYQKAQNGK